VLAASQASFVPDLMTENACPGTWAMDAARNDRDWDPGQHGPVSPAVGWQVSRTSAPMPASGDGGRQQLRPTRLPRASPGYQDVEAAVTEDVLGEARLTGTHQR
jgi:hypothetical protein